MRYIKLYEDLNKYYYEINKKEYGELCSSCSDNNLSNSLIRKLQILNNRLEIRPSSVNNGIIILNPDLNSNYAIDISILEDEWFIVGFYDYTNGFKKSFFKCDQYEGLVEFMTDKKVIDSKIYEELNESDIEHDINFITDLVETYFEFRLKDGFIQNGDDLWDDWDGYYTVNKFETKKAGIDGIMFRMVIKLHLLGFDLMRSGNQSRYDLVDPILYGEIHNKVNTFYERVVKSIDCIEFKTSNINTTMSNGKFVFYIPFMKLSNDFIKFQNNNPASS